MQQICGGLGNSMLNMVYLANLGENRPMLLRDEALMTSFCWELLRHNGPPLTFRLREDTVIPTSMQRGDTYRVRRGTVKRE